VRLAGLDDVGTLARLRRAWTQEQAGRRLDDDGFAEAFAAWFEREYHQRLTWLAEVDGVAVGMLNMLVFTRMPKPAVPGRAWSSQWGYVANVYVDAAARDRGTGRLLLDAAVDHARERGFARLVLSPSERSVPFYARAGFAPATSLMVLDLG
jgi:GNAT superfamily N-acetyltransferase